MEAQIGLPARTPGTDRVYVDIAFAIDEHFLPPLAACMASIGRHNPGSEIAFHIFTESLEPTNLDKLEQVASTFGASIKLYLCDPAVFDRLPDNGYSRSVYYRLFICERLRGQIQRVLYLDADIICEGSLSALFKADLQGKAIAAVPDVEQEKRFGEVGLPGNWPYFNAGVLLIDIDLWLESKVSEKCLELISQKAGEFNDQDALNVVLEGEAIYLEPQWNYIAGCALREYPNLDPRLLALKLEIQDGNPPHNILVHFTGQKPWNQWHRSYGDPRFYKNLDMTPWAGWRCKAGTPKQKFSAIKYALKRSLRMI